MVIRDKLTGQARGFGFVELGEGEDLQRAVRPALTYSNMLTLNALVELLSEKGLLDKQEILDRVKKLQTGMRAKRKPN